jgi:UDP-N-acetylmuramyl tripeptide synthase
VVSRNGYPIDARLGLAVAGARCVSGLSRVLGVGGGTAAPGHLASRVDPQALEKLAGRLEQGAVLVAGTNGKTTTARILADILAADGRHVVHNRAGANLVEGILATLTADAPTRGRLGPSIAVLETDEGALPEVLTRVSPTLVVLTNLFRDQLDRFSEVDMILAAWRRALEDLSTETTLVINADDPSLVALTDGLEARRVLFGIEESLYQLDEVPHAAEVISCLRCARPFSYRSIYLGHLGDWRCEHCGTSRPPLDVAGRDVELWSYDFQSLKVTGAGTDTRFEVGLPGLYNSYNVVAAIAAGRTLGVPGAVAKTSLSHYRGAFGRAERVVYRGRSLMIMLVKNPVGCNEVLRTISGVDRAFASPMLLCLNDQASDGRDVSWIWDVDYEQLASSPTDLYCAGTRWADMCNRLYYAGVQPERIHPLGADLGLAVDSFAAALPEKGSGFILPTYSAMLAIRHDLSRRDHLAAFWSE